MTDLQNPAPEALAAGPLARWHMARFLVPSVANAVRLGALSLLASMLAGLPAAYWGDAAVSRRYLVDPTESPAELLETIVAAPLLETLISGLLPLWLLGLIGVPAGWSVAVTTLLFALAHFDSFSLNLTFALDMFALLPGGFLLTALCLLTFRRAGFWPAFLFTSAIHAVNNALVSVALLLV